MNFIDRCFELFEKTSKTHDLSKDVENYNKALYYKDNFALISRKEVEQFIVSVRMDNPIAAISEAVAKALRGNLDVISNIPPENLYQELQGEIANLVLKGALDSLKLLNSLNDEQAQRLAERLYNGDLAIFNEYCTL